MHGRMPIELEACGQYVILPCLVKVGLTAASSPEDTISVCILLATRAVSYIPAIAQFPTVPFNRAM